MRKKNTQKSDINSLPIWEASDGDWDVAVCKDSFFPFWFVGFLDDFFLSDIWNINLNAYSTFNSKLPDTFNEKFGNNTVCQLWWKLKIPYLF